MANDHCDAFRKPLCGALDASLETMATSVPPTLAEGEQARMCGAPQTNSPTRAKRVCAIAYDELCTFEFGIAVEVFGLKRPELDVPWYDFKLAAVEPGPLRAIGGFSVQVDNDLSVLECADLIIVPGWRGCDAPVPPALLKALLAAHKRGATLASICSGVFVLAATGLLDGLRATTHWRYADVLAERFPQIIVEPDILYVDSGSILTSAGSAAGLDMCLHIVRSDYGSAIGNSVARRLVLPAHRDGGQAQFIPRPVARTSGGGLAPALDELRSRLDEDWPIVRIADLCGVTRRTLLRRFHESTGTSPNVWLRQERLALARDLLETTVLGVSSIAAACGFGAPETLRHHFRRATGISPLAYRRSFRG